MVNVIIFVAPVGTTAQREDAQDVIIVPAVNPHLGVALYPQRVNIASRVNPESIKIRRANRLARIVRRASTNIRRVSLLVWNVRRGSTSYLPRNLVKNVLLASMKRMENAKNATLISFLMKVPLSVRIVPTESIRIKERPAAVLALLVNIQTRVYVIVTRAVAAEIAKKTIIVTQGPRIATDVPQD